MTFLFLKLKAAIASSTVALEKEKEVLASQLNDSRREAEDAKAAHSALEAQKKALQTDLLAEISKLENTSQHETDQLRVTLTEVLQVNPDISILALCL